jgi:amidophosphoribosyltransferase
LVIGEKEGSYCASFESCTFNNLGYMFSYSLARVKCSYDTDGIEKIHLPEIKEYAAFFMGLLRLSILNLRGIER